eukprot:scaffold12110_cov58-Cyclotella_meneghiniana.AAC.2
MAAPPNEPPTLKFAYQIELEVDDPAVVPNGPKGTRICIPVLGGRFKGANPDFHGEIAPSVDFAIGHSDGSGITLKVQLVMKTHDGATLLATIEGRSDRDHDNPANARIHTSKTYETCDERFKWMNNQILVGQGKKEGHKIVINYYQIV